MPISHKIKTSDRRSVSGQWLAGNLHVLVFMWALLCHTPPTPQQDNVSSNIHPQQDVSSQTINTIREWFKGQEKTPPGPIELSWDTTIPPLTQQVPKDPRPMFWRQVWQPPPPKGPPSMSWHVRAGLMAWEGAITTQTYIFPLGIFTLLYSLCTDLYHECEDGGIFFFFFLSYKKLSQTVYIMTHKKLEHASVNLEHFSLQRT